MGRSDIHPTPHLIEKMAARKVTWGDVVDVIESPEVTHGPNSQGRYVHQKGQLAVVVTQQGAVITVLLRQEGQWTDEDMKARMR